MTLSIFWLVMIVGLTLIELNTANLVCLWFIAGSVGGLLTNFFTSSFLFQCVICAFVSGATLALTKPMADRMKRKPVPTNSDMVIGKFGEVTETITTNQKGRVRVNGQSWMAESRLYIPVGRRVKVLKIQGVTLEVVPSEDNN